MPILPKKISSKLHVYVECFIHVGYNKQLFSIENEANSKRFHEIWTYVIVMSVNFGQKSCTVLLHHKYFLIIYSCLARIDIKL